MFRWKQLRYRLESACVAALARVIPRLPRRKAVRLGHALGSIAYLADFRGRDVAMANLECAFGDHFTHEQRCDMARASYQNFLRTMVDLVWAQKLTSETWSTWMRTEGFDAIREQLAREDRGTVFMCVHQGNWEWASLACGFLGFGNVVVAENFKNPRLTAIFNAMRQHSGQTIIPQENSLLRMLRTVRRGGATGMLIDLTLPPSQMATVIEGFGMKMCVPVIHAILAERGSALLVPVETQPQPDGTCRIIAHLGVEFSEGASMQEIAQRCWDAFVPALDERPQHWLWPYKHFRYAPSPATRKYPFYANGSARFERLLRRAPKRGAADSRR